MGSLFSSPFHEDPSKYAVKVTDNLDHSRVPSYDYVIVGGGTAACVLAHRLTEDPNVSVLVIEAGVGHKGHLNSRIPLLFSKNLKSAIDWNYTTTNQVNADGRPRYWPSGKVVGGSSMINAMMYQRPCADDINEWSRLGGDGWTWDNFKSYLTKAEKYTIDPTKPNSLASHRGTSGLWKTRHLDTLDITDSYLEACNNIGIRRIDDTSGPNGPLGATFVSGFIDNNLERCSASTAYLTPDVLKRRNLIVAIKACVSRIITSDSSGTIRAIGVEFSQANGGPVYRVYTHREIICSAGAIKTPQVLTASGIGPKEELQRLGIQPVQELDAVGKYLSDHACVTVAFKAEPGTTYDYLIRPIPGLIALIKWLVIRTGPLGSIAGQSYAFLKSTNASLPTDLNPSEPIKVENVTAGDQQPDLEIVGGPVGFKNHGFTLPPPKDNIFTLLCTLLRPLSRGTITLKSANIWDGANIDPNYLSHENDLNVLLKCVRLSLRIARTAPFSQNLQLPDNLEESDDIYFPGHSNPDKISDEALIRYIRKTVETLYHPMGTARIGKDRNTSVVDPELRVHGISNLRVVDASVFPGPMAGHTTATVIGLAERAADIIKGSVNTN